MKEKITKENKKLDTRFEMDKERIIFVNPK
jgi:hypothetical protein